MSRVDETPNARLCTSQLEEILAEALRFHVSVPCRISKLERRPSALRSSFALEELDILLVDGTTLRLMFKDLSWEALNESGRRAKPAFLYDPLREIEMYQSVLPHYQFGTAICYGALTNRAQGQYWLFLERVSGSELYRVGEFDVWQEVARWLAVMHGRLAGEVELRRTTHLLVYNEAFYRVWLQRAVAFISAADLAGAGAKADSLYCLVRGLLGGGDRAWGLASATLPVRSTLGGDQSLPLEKCYDLPEFEPNSVTTSRSMCAKSREYAKVVTDLGSPAPPCYVLRP